jgi:hypothetical protein
VVIECLQRVPRDAWAAGKDAGGLIATLALTPGRPVAGDKADQRPPERAGKAIRGHRNAGNRPGAGCTRKWPREFCRHRRREACPCALATPQPRARDGGGGHRRSAIRLCRSTPALAGAGCGNGVRAVMRVSSTHHAPDTLPGVLSA